MRQLLILVFVCLMLGGIFIAFYDYQTYSNSVLAEPDLVPTRMMLGNAPLDPEIKVRMDEVFEKTESTIQAANTAGKLMGSCSYWLGWIGALCSWVILGITAFMKNNLPENKVDNSKMPRKTVVTGVLAVVAAVSPVAISKFDSGSAQKYEHADTLRNDKSSVRTEVSGGSLTKNESLALLDKLMDKAGR